MYPSFAKNKSPVKRTTYSDIVALIKHINSTPMSRKQESPGFFFVDCTSVHCNRSHEDENQELSEISDFSTYLDTTPHSQMYFSSPFSQAQTNVNQLHRLSPISSLLTPSTLNSTPFRLSPGPQVQTPVPTRSEDISLAMDSEFT